MSNISWQLILCEMIGSSSFLPLYCPSPSVSPVVTTGQFPVSEGRCLLGREEAFTTYQPWASLAGSLFCLASLGSMRWASIKYMLIRINCAWSEALGELRREVMGRGASLGTSGLGTEDFGAPDDQPAFRDASRVQPSSLTASQSALALACVRSAFLSTRPFQATPFIHPSSNQPFHSSVFH